jgi:hypothetical protein
MQSTLRYPDGSEYIGKKNKFSSEKNCFFFKGESNKDGQRHGFGRLIFSDHAKYSGQFENGLFSGLGCITYPDGSKYLKRCVFFVSRILTFIFQI